MSEFLDSIISKAKTVADDIGSSISGDNVIRTLYKDGLNRTKAYAKIAKLTLNANRENDELIKVYTEIGKLYFDQNAGKAEGFYTPLFAQVEALSSKISDIEAEIDAIRSEISESTEDTSDIEVEITEDSQ